jgi:hypothetical protein
MDPLSFLGSTSILGRIYRVPCKVEKIRRILGKSVHVTRRLGLLGRIRHAGKESRLLYSRRW